MVHIHGSSPGEYWQLGSGPVGKIDLHVPPAHLLIISQKKWNAKNNLETWNRNCCLPLSFLYQAMLPHFIFNRECPMSQGQLWMLCGQRWSTPARVLPTALIFQSIQTCHLLTSQACQPAWASFPNLFQSFLGQPFCLHSCHSRPPNVFCWVKEATLQTLTDSTF